MASRHVVAAPAPVSFGTAEAPVLGILHRPGEGSASGLGVLICASIGNEGVVLHRALRRLAARLAAAGDTVLRFDPPASGDSGGADDLPGRIRLWRDSILDAALELRQHEGIRELALVGVRLGGTMAVAAVDAGLEATALVLWDAPPTGEEWLREERAYDRLMRLIPVLPENPPPGDGAEELTGFLLAGDAVDELRELDVACDEPPARAAGLRVLLDSGSPHAPSLRAALAGRGAQVDELPLPGLRETLEELEKASPPNDAIESITSWLDAVRAGPAAPPRPLRAPAGPAGLSLTVGGVRVREQPLLVDREAGRLYGVVCEPEEAREPSPRYAVLFNAGFVRHIGPNRMYVRWARDWAAAGLPSFRVDGRSVGESDGADGPHTSFDELYSAGALQDAVRLVRALEAERSPGELVALGLCSGAYTAFQAALEVPSIRSVVLLNPPTLRYTPRESEQRYAAALWRSLLSARRWQSMLRRKSAVRQLRERAAFVLRAGTHSLTARTRPAAAPSDWVARSLERLRADGVRVQFVMSEGDPGLAYLEDELGPQFERVRPDCFELHVIGSTDHTFRPLAAQERLRLVLDRVLDLPAAVASSGRARLSVSD